MSEPQRETGSPEAVRPEGDQEEPTSQGPNLALIYSLIALALIAAIGIALTIVMPFHHRR